MPGTGDNGLAADGPDGGADSESDSSDEERDSSDDSCWQDSPVSIAVGKEGEQILWVLKSGQEAKLEGMDMHRSLHVRVGFAPVEGPLRVR